jgi:hypothetical protein
MFGVLLCWTWDGSGVGGRSGYLHDRYHIKVTATHWRMIAELGLDWLSIMSLSVNIATADTHNSANSDPCHSETHSEPRPIRTAQVVCSSRGSSTSRKCRRGFQFNECLSHGQYRPNAFIPFMGPLNVMLSVWCIKQMRSRSPS